MTFIDSIRRQLQDMSATERQRAISSLRDLIYEDAHTHALHPVTDDGVACPRCGSLDVVRKGHDHDGTQRWLCKDCHRTFRNAADTIITRSKLRPAVWMRYLECFVDCLPLRECASRCHISLRTSWLMRMRLIESIRRHLPRFHAAAGCAVQLDETYLRESFKGNHRRGKFRLPRPASQGHARVQARPEQGANLRRDRRRRRRKRVPDHERTRPAIQEPRHHRVGREACTRSLRNHRQGRRLPRSHGNLGRHAHSNRGGRPRHQPGQYAPLPLPWVSQWVPWRKHETAGRIPRMVPMEANLHAGPGEHRRPSGQRHPMRQHRARLGARDAAVHGLLGRHDIDCMHNVASRNGRSRAWRTRRPPPCASTPNSKTRP